MTWKSLVGRTRPLVALPLNGATPYESVEGIAFAWFPHRATDGNTYWLQECKVIIFWGVVRQGWIVERWVGSV